MQVRQATLASNAAVPRRMSQQQSTWPPSRPPLLLLLQNRQAADAAQRPPFKRWVDEEIIERQFREKQEALAKEVRGGVGLGVSWLTAVARRHRGLDQQVSRKAGPTCRASEQGGLKPSPPNLPFAPSFSAPTAGGGAQGGCRCRCGPLPS